jgi:hypothetical protein
MAYALASTGNQYSLGAQKMQHFVVTADAATGNLALFPAGTQVLGVVTISRGTTPHAWGHGYNIATGTVYWAGGGAVTADVYVTMP